MSVPIFPGMDPYLEGDFWTEFHARLASRISDQLMPRLRPKLDYSQPFPPPELNTDDAEWVKERLKGLNAQTN